MTQSRLTRTDRWLALLLFVGTFSALGLAQRDQGVMRDEGTYFQAAEHYWGWFAELGDNLKAGRFKASFTPASIGRYWGTNNEHPVLFKTLFAFSWRAFHRCECTKKGAQYHPLAYDKPHKTLGWLSEISAFRLPGWLFYALAVVLVFLLGVQLEHRTAGLTAALLYATLPQAFFHGQLACFDSGVTTCWLLVVYAYVRSLTAARWGIYAGLVFGVALAAKHNAWFLPPLLLLHYLAVVRPDLSLRPLRLPRVPLAFLAMALLGPLVFFAHWPWLWFETRAHLEGYFGFHLHHAYYNMEYLGTNWGPPPLPVSYPFGMTLFTAPVVLQALGLVGLLIYARAPLYALLERFTAFRAPVEPDLFRFPAKRTWLRPGLGLNPRPGLLFFVNALFPLALIAHPKVPIFGGTKHFMPAFPFLALLAGVAVARLCGWLADQGRARWAGIALPLLLALPGATSTALTHPFGLSQYNALAGGPAGGADLGLNRQFWGYAPRQLLPWMNETLPRNSRVYFHDLSHDSYGAYLRDGLLRPDIVYSGMELPAIEASTHALVIYELHFNKYDYWIWNAFGTVRPEKVLTLDGVPLVAFYKR